MNSRNPGKELVNEFPFDGGPICDPVQQPNNNNTEEEQLPSATEAPTDTGGD